MAVKKPPMNSIVRIDNERKCVVVHGDLSDANFRAMVEISIPAGYFVEQWKPERTEKQVLAAKQLAKRNGEYYESILDEEEMKIFNAIKKASFTVKKDGEDKVVKRGGFSYARKWVEDGKQMDGNNPVVNIYKGSGKGKTIDYALTIEL